MEILSPAFRDKKEGQSPLLASAVSQVTISQNNQYANAVFEGTCCQLPYLSVAFVCKVHRSLLLISASLSSFVLILAFTLC